MESTDMDGDRRPYECWLAFPAREELISAKGIGLSAYLNE